MKIKTLYTNKDLAGKNKESYYQRKLNSIYVYAESSKSMDSYLKQYQEVIATVALYNGMLWNNSFLCSMARKDINIANLDYSLIRELINMLCREGILLKKGAISSSGTMYSFILHIDKLEGFVLVFDYVLDILDKTNVVSINDIQKMFNNVKGSYYWAVIMIDYFVWLGLGTHSVDGSLIGF